MHRPISLIAATARLQSQYVWVDHKSALNLVIGDQVIPQRISFNASTLLLVCNYECQSCRGMIPPDYNPQGDCLEGYQGILCSECSPGYSLTNNFQCGLCPDLTLNSLRIVGIGVGTILLLIHMVRSTLAGATQKLSISSTYEKILLNHIQLVVLTSNFDLDWPAMVKQFFQTQAPVGEATTQIYSFDCFLNQETKNSNGTYTMTKFPIDVFFFKLLLFVLMPFFLIIIPFIIWKIILRRNMEMYIPKSISTLVILLFFVHPNIVSYVFNAIKQSSYLTNIAVFKSMMIKD